MTLLFPSSVLFYILLLLLVLQAQQAAGAGDGTPNQGVLTLLVNPQWQAGQVISDFGFGSRRQNIEKFLLGFQDVYYLKQQRILGDDIL